MMKVMDPKEHAARCAKRLRGEPLNTFGATFPAQEAHLDDDLIAALSMKKALERFGLKLLAQYENSTIRSGGKIVGVELHSINFTFLTQPRKGDT